MKGVQCSAERQKKAFALYLIGISGSLWNYAIHHLKNGGLPTRKYCTEPFLDKTVQLIGR
jgi:hypothetical protein